MDMEFWKLFKAEVVKLQTELGISYPQALADYCTTVLETCEVEAFTIGGPEHVEFLSHIADGIIRISRKQP